MHTVALLVESNFPGHSWHQLVEAPLERGSGEQGGPSAAQSCTQLIDAIRHVVWPYGGKGGGDLVPAAHSRSVQGTGGDLAEPHRIWCGAMWCDGAYPVSVGEKKRSLPCSTRAFI
jgi:hypothetical protein